MCFSYTASFVAGSLLSATGVVTTLTSEKKREIPFASIPIFFGIQQAIEGVVWLGQENFLYTESVYIYLFFAYCVWPFLIPFSALCLEQNKKRKKFVMAIFILGCLVSLYFLYYLTRSNITVKIVGFSLSYSYSPPFLRLVNSVYIFVVVAGGLISSHRALRIFSLLLVPSLALAYAINQATTASVWCFFAAILSGVIVLDRYRVLKERVLK
jgi:hypothetical protein